MLYDRNMIEKNILKRLQKDRKFNPFNKDYDFEAVSECVREVEINEETTQELLGAISSCLCTIYINPLYDEIYTRFYHEITSSNLSVYELISFLVANVNRNYLLIQKKISINTRDKREVHFLDPYRFTVESYDDSIGDIDAKAAIESDLDNLILILSYLRYFEGQTFNKKGVDKPEIESVDHVLRLSMYGSFYNVIKSSYEDAIWNNGYLYYKEDSERKIVIDYHSHREQKLLKVGQIRLTRNMFGTFLNYIDINDNQGFESPFQEFKLKKRIKTVLVNDGYIEYRLGKGIDKKEADNEVNLLSELETYYPFIGNQDFPNFQDLNLRKVLIMFSSLQYLFKQVLHRIKIENDEVKSLKDFYKFPFKVKVHELKRYLKSKLSFSNKQINDFFSLMEGKFEMQSRVDIWNKPFVRYKDEYLVPLLGINDSLSIHLLDRWLNDGGFSLEKRGHLLESYLKTQVSFQINQKGFECYIPDQSMFKIPSKGKEEIDLIINLKNCLVVAEVKCIKYPLEVRDFHNAYKRLLKASKQVKRKTTFIKNNIAFFEEKLKGIKDKEIVRLIVTNFPNYTGFLIDEIPVVDLYFLESYIISGKLSKRKIQFQKAKASVQDEYEKIEYYRNEDEFSQNFEKTMKNPPPVLEIESAIEIQENKKSLKGSTIDLYVNEPILSQ